MRMFKKGLAMALALMMLVVAMPFGGLAVYADETYPILEKDVVTTATIDRKGETARFHFTPRTSGYYVFYSMAEDIDPRAFIYSSRGEQLAFDDDGGENYNFRAIAYLVAGETYLLEAGIWNNGTGTYPVAISAYETRTITSVDFHDLTFNYMEWQEMGGWFIPGVTVYFSDGTVEERQSEWIYDDVRSYYVSWTSDSDTAGWKIGETHTVTGLVEDLGIEETFTVTIESSPVVSVTVEKQQYIKDYHGWMTQDSYYDEDAGQWMSTPEYRRYNVSPHSELITITLKDGSVVQDSGFYWEGRWYGLQYDDPQSYDNQWTDLGTYTVGASIAGYDFTYEVEIIDSPIASVAFEPISVIEHTNGYWNRGTYWDDKLQQDIPYEYYYYHVYPRVTVTMKDGTVYENARDFWWGDGWHSLNVEQNYDNYLQLGVNRVTGSVLGYTYTMEIEVMETPIASVTVPTVTLIENSNGDWNTEGYYDDEGNYVEGEYFYYWSYGPQNATITMKDGTVYENCSGFEWNGEWHGLSYYGLSYENQLHLGENERTFSILGYEGTYTVEVIESPVASVEILPAVRLQYDNGYWNNGWYWDENDQQVNYEYFYYYDLLPRWDSVTITLKDGTVINDRSFQWNGKIYSFNIENQNYDRCLELGVNEWSGEIAGYNFTYVIEIVETPVVSVVAGPVSLVEEQNGYWNHDTYWDDELQDYVAVEWFYYHDSYMKPSITVTLQDGTVYTNCNGFNWNGRWYSLDVADQDAHNHLEPGRNVWSGSIAGYDFEYEIQVSTLSSNEAFEYMENEDTVIITDCYLTDATVVIPATINGKAVVGVAGLGNIWPTLRHLILSDSVTYIGEYILTQMDYLESVHIGASVSNLTAEMFGYCWNLKRITISEDNPYYCVVNGGLHNKALDTFIAYPMGGEDPAYVVPATVVNIDVLDWYSIYSNLDVTFAEDHVAFVSVDGVTYNKEMTKVISCRKDKTGSYVMPETVEEIADGAFMNTKLTSVVVSPKVTEIVYCAFASCASLESVTLPEGLISIEQSAFEQTFALESINLPEGLEYIGYYSFYKTGLKDLNVPGSVERIENNAFYMSKVTNLTLGEGIAEIGVSAFAKTPITSAVLPNSLTYLGSYAFENCLDLGSVRIGSGLTTIEEGAFANCGLYSLAIPNTVSVIYDSAFRDCARMGSVTLGEGLGYIGACAFSGCDMLMNLTVSGNNDTYFSNGNCVITHDGALVVGCPGSIIPNDGSVTRIEDYAFFDCNGLKAVTIPDSVEHIGRNAFTSSDNIQSIVIPDSVSYIDVYAFSYMHNLRSAKLGDGIEFMGSGAFTGCALEAVDLGNSVPFVAPHAFDYTNLQEVFIPSSVTSLMYSSFEYCESLTSIEIPITVETIEENAFRGCHNLSDVYYQGTEADRNAMYIETWGNQYLLDATWHYEWTNEKWAPIPECDHVYDNDCDGDCNLCGRKRTAPHAYENACDDYCDACGEWRAVTAHVYDNACDIDCNECGEYRKPAGHVYDNACDANCNECGATREVAGHWYDSACDTDCNECGAIRAAAAHTYDNKYDEDCNECGAVRKVSDPITFAVGSAHARPGETFDVAVSIENNSGVIGFRFDVEYDETLFELIGATAGEAFASASFGPMRSPFNVLWIDAIHPNNTTNGEIVVLTFRVKEDAAIGAYDIAVHPYEDDVIDSDMESVPFITVSGGVSVIDSIPGDADGDGKLDLQDLGLLMRHLNGWDTEVDETVLDVNCDGKVNNRDFALIQRYLNGWDITLY